MGAHSGALHPAVSCFVQVRLPSKELIFQNDHQAAFEHSEAPSYCVFGLHHTRCVDRGWTLQLFYSENVSHLSNTAPCFSPMLNTDWSVLKLLEMYTT